MKKYKILVLGNCTHWSIAESLRLSGFFYSVSSAMVFSLSEKEREEIYDGINNFDIVVSLEHADWAGSLATKNLRSSIGNKLITLPTPFFSGLTPDIAYIKYGDEIARSSAVIGDYHSALILEEIKSGFSSDEIIYRYISGKAFERLNIIDIWDANIAELKEREKNTDIKISDFIEKSTIEKTIQDQFLSFNHPAEGLINHIAKKIIALTCGLTIEQQFIKKENHNLYLGPQLPVHPYVAEILSLPQSKNKKFKRCETLGGDWIDVSEFVRLSVDYFKSVADIKSFQVTTPAYLSSKIAKFFKSNQEIDGCLSSKDSSNMAKEEKYHNLIEVAKFNIEKLQKIWKNIPDDYPGDYQGLTVKSEALINNLYRLKGEDVIDIGCNSGLYSLLSAGVANSVIGIDPSKELIKRAEAGKAYFHDSVYFLHNLKFINGNFADYILHSDATAVIAALVLYHLGDKNIEVLAQFLKKKSTKILIQARPGRANAFKSHPEWGAPSTTTLYGGLFRVEDCLEFIRDCGFDNAEVINMGTEFYGEFFPIIYAEK